MLSNATNQPKSTVELGRNNSQECFRSVYICLHFTIIDSKPLLLNPTLKYLHFSMNKAIRCFMNENMTIDNEKLKCDTQIYLNIFQYLSRFRIKFNCWKLSL